MSTGKRRHRRSGPAPQLIERLHQAGRESSTATVAFHTALAQLRGLSPTDEKAVDVLLRHGPLTHGALGDQVGLAAASVSDLIDRLEAKGYVERSPHPEDGRKVLVTALTERINREMAPLFGEWVAALEELYATFSDEQLETICEFLTEAATRQQAATHALRGTAL